MEKIQPVFQTIHIMTNGCNDFSIIKDKSVWHIVGITHPRPSGFIDDFNFAESNIHEAEYQLFHCCAESDNFENLMFKNSFEDKDKILYPASRPNEIPKIWAPHLMKIDDSFGIVYSPSSMRMAKTKDFNKFE